MKIDLNFKNDDNIFALHEADTPYLSFRALDKLSIFPNAFTTRHGGVSEGWLSSLNLTLKKEGETREHILENFRRVAESAGFDMERMVLSDQTHTTNVREVTEADAGKGLLRSSDFESVDGLVTNVPGITLVTFYADCVPLYIADPVHKAIGLSHSGWRGTVGRMGEITLRKMSELYGTEPKDVVCCVGPSICRDCFEVGPEVSEEFRDSFPETCHKDIILGPSFNEAGEEKYHIDLWKANELIFRMAGVRPEHISVTNVCTRCNTDTFWSHRALGTKRGNMAAFLSLRP